MFVRCEDYFRAQSLYNSVSLGILGGSSTALHDFWCLYVVKCCLRDEWSRNVLKNTHETTLDVNFSHIENEIYRGPTFFWFIKSNIHCTFILKKYGLLIVLLVCSEDKTSFLHSMFTVYKLFQNFTVDFIDIDITLRTVGHPNQSAILHQTYADSIPTRI